MLTYITAFIFYTLAMIGILLIGFVIYKKTFMVTGSENKGHIKIIDSVQIAPKKMLLVVKVNNERFLIASGAEHTTFLSKLDDNLIKQKILAQKTELKPQEKLSAIQKQFKELYSKEEESIEPVEQMDYIEDKKELSRKEMIKRLLKDFNNSRTKTESRF